MISDLHVGAGADKSNIDDMVKIVNDMNADCLFICGDIVDSSTSISDIEYLKQSLEKINTTYGIYAVEGNHEEQCRYDIGKHLEGTDVIFLNDEAALINNEVVVIGLYNEPNKKVCDIKKEYKIDNKYTIVLQHKPEHLKSIQNDADLVLCGHTHGYQYPFTAVTTPIFNDMRQGIKNFNNMTAVTSSGLSQWGYHTKWPSHSEVVEIIIN